MLGFLIIIIYYLFMNKNAIIPASNTEVLQSLDQLNKGNRKPATQLVFDPSTGEFVIAKTSDNLPADATTINSIAQDGFANKAK
ncbi:hypothetical protein GCM10022388_19040 [Flavobacterium chungnamense]|uniref:Uncharacterized protein n=2 Tax=Flavobacterium chungnamense TaxID=706182 RepID=A0ABP7UUD7_9FLAO